MSVEAWIAFATLSVTILAGLIHISIRIGRLTAAAEAFHEHKTDNEREHEALWGQLHQQRDWIIALRSSRGE